MSLVINPGRPLQGEVHLPGDKSLSHRAALFSTLAEGTSRIENFLHAGVTEVLLQSLAAMGILWTLEGNTLTVHGRGLSGLGTPTASLDCGHSATTIRFLAGAIGGAGLQAVLDGTPGLRRRPMGRVVEPLQQMAVPITASDEGTAPLVLAARKKTSKLKGLVYTLPVASAQVKTALLLAGLGAAGPVILTEPGPSRDHSERMLANMGAALKTEKLRAPGKYAAVTLHPQDGPLQPLQLRLPGDFSSAAFLIVAGLVTPGSEIVIRGVGLNPTRTGLLDILLQMGAQIEVELRGEPGGEPVGDLRIRHSALNGVAVSGELVVRMIDEFPAFAVAAAYAGGRSTVTQAAELRLKESDRITSLCSEIKGLGVSMTEQPDGFLVEGLERVEGGRVSSHRDHRLGMALAVAGLAAQRLVVLEDARIISESFPGFIYTLGQLGADIHQTEDGI